MTDLKKLEEAIYQFSRDIPATPYGLARLGVEADMTLILNAARAWLDSQKIETRRQPASSLRHYYEPDKKYPWFCRHCGYAEHEMLKHIERPALTKESTGG